MNAILTGFSYLITGFGLITRPGLKRFVIIPIIINLFIFLALYFLLQHFVTEFNHWLQTFLPNWLQWLSYIVWLLFFISFMLFFMFVFVVLANLIGAPFNGLLSEKVELYLTGYGSVEMSVFSQLKDFPGMIGRQLGLLCYFLPRALVILLLFLVPVIQSLVPFIWFLFSAWYMSLSFIDFPLDNHKRPLKEVYQFLDQDRWMSLGFGMAVLLFLTLPVVNLFVIPAAVAGATKWWIDKRVVQ